MYDTESKGYSGCLKTTLPKLHTRYTHEWRILLNTTEHVRFGLKTLPFWFETVFVRLHKTLHTVGNERNLIDKEMGSILYL